MSTTDYLVSVRLALDWLDRELASNTDEDFKLAAAGLLKHISNRLDALKLSVPADGAH